MTRNQLELLISLTNAHILRHALIGEQKLADDHEKQREVFAEALRKLQEVERF